MNGNKENISLLNECFQEYANPIYIVGNVGQISESEYLTNISATIPKRDLIILNGVYPEWARKVFDNANKKDNILVINDFEQISTEEQKLFKDIITRGYISSIKLPDNLKILIISKDDVPLIGDIYEVTEHIYL